MALQVLADDVTRDAERPARERRGPLRNSVVVRRGRSTPPRRPLRWCGSRRVRCRRSAWPWASGGGSSDRRPGRSRRRSRAAGRARPRRSGPKPRSAASSFAGSSSSSGRAARSPWGRRRSTASVPGRRVPAGSSGRSRSATGGSMPCWRPAVRVRVRRLRRPAVRRWPRSARGPRRLRCRRGRPPPSVPADVQISAFRGRLAPGSFRPGLRPFPGVGNVGDKGFAYAVNDLRKKCRSAQNAILRTLQVSSRIREVASYQWVTGTRGCFLEGWLGSHRTQWSRISIWLGDAAVSHCRIRSSAGEAYQTLDHLRNPNVHNDLAARYGCPETLVRLGVVSRGSSLSERSFGGLGPVPGRGPGSVHFARHAAPGYAPVHGVSPCLIRPSVRRCGFRSVRRPATTW